MTRCRWLAEGQEYCYAPKLDKGNDGRRGTLCRVETVSRAGTTPGNVLASWLDKYRAIVPTGVLRKSA